MIAQVAVVSALLLLVQMAYAQAANGQNDENHIWEQLAGVADTANILAIIGIAAGFGIYWYDSRRQDKDIKKKAYTTISWEIDDIEETLTATKFSTKEMMTSEPSKPGEQRVIRFTNAYLFDEAYSSLINSGSFVQLNKDLQFLLAELYARIRRHNELLTYLDQLRDAILYSSGDVEKNKEMLNIAKKRYFDYMENMQKEIKERLPKIRELIKSEIRLVPHKPAHVLDQS